MRGQENVVFANNAAAGTFGPFELKGGKYAFDYTGTGTGTVDLERKGPDGVTYLKVITQITATTGTQTVDLPPGQYECIIATFTASYAQITRIPND
jgi:hypothetical protein